MYGHKSFFFFFYLAPEEDAAGQRLHFEEQQGSTEFDKFSQAVGHNREGGIGCYICSFFIHTQQGIVGCLRGEEEEVESSLKNCACLGKLPKFFFSIIWGSM